MTIAIDDTPGEGWMFPSERARYALNPHFHVVDRHRPKHDTLIRVDRDPCFKCGARGDLGCSHTRRG